MFISFLAAMRPMEMRWPMQGEFEGGGIPIASTSAWISLGASLTRNGYGSMRAYGFCANRGSSA